MPTSALIGGAKVGDIETLRRIAAAGDIISFYAAKTSGRRCVVPAAGTRPHLTVAA